VGAGGVVDFGFEGREGVGEFGAGETWGHGFKLEHVLSGVWRAAEFGGEMGG
jgi:hypothetical protein